MFGWIVFGLITLAAVCPEKVVGCAPCGSGRLTDIKACKKNARRNLGL